MLRRRSAVVHAAIGRRQQFGDGAADRIHGGASITADISEQGIRAILNYGHTIGHGVETATAFDGQYLHGEAVAIGLCAAARLSQKLGGLAAADVGRVARMVAAHALPTQLRSPLAYPALHAAMTRDKKVRAGGLRFVVLKALGTAVTQGDVAPALVEESFREVGAV